MSEHQKEQRKQPSHSEIPGLSAMLDALKAKVDEALPDTIGQFFVHVDETLFDKADGAANLSEQRIYFDAMRMLRHQQQSLAQNILHNYQKSFSALQTNDLSLLLSATSYSSDRLEVVENHVLEEMIALDNIVSSLIGACGENLGFLSKRLEYMLGRPLRDEENPFVPEILAETFASQLAPLHIELPAKLLVFQLFEKYFMRHWPNVVSECNQLLKARGVRPNLEEQKRQIVKDDTNVRSEKSKAARIVKEGEAIAGAEGKRTKLASPMVDDLRRFLASSLQLPSLGGGQTNSAPIDSGQLLHAIAGLNANQQGREQAQNVEKILSEDGLEVALAALLTSQNQNINDLNIEERSIIRVLDSAFNKLNQQPLAPQDLSGLVRKMELPIASMVLQDPQFLDKKNHPGRRLVNEIFKACSTFLDGEEAATDPLRQQVDTLTTQLMQMDLRPKELSRMLSEFMEFVDKDKRRLSVREQRLMEEEEAMAKVSVTHGLVYDQMSPLFIGEKIPRILLNFCEDAWSKVMFLDILRNGKDSESWRQRLQEFQELYDAVLQKNTLTSASIDQLLFAINEQLEGISLDAAARHRWLEWLKEYFQWSMVGSPVPSPQLTEIIDVKKLILRLPGVVRVAIPEDSETDLRALESVDSLKKGIWVEFKATEASEPVRCKLAGVVKPTATYLFTNRKGVKVAEASRNHLAGELKVGNVVVLENTKLFDNAFADAVNDLKVANFSSANVRKQKASGAKINDVNTPQ